MPEYTPEIPQSRYQTLSTERDKYKRRAQEYAKVTLPYIMPDTEDVSSQELQNDFNSVGAELVNGLANRYTQELFPPTRPFFRLRIDEGERTETQDTAKMDALLALGERRARWAFEQRQARPVLLDLLTHCIITGNALLYFPEEAGSKPVMYALDEYVVNRSVSGEVLEIITVDTKAINALDEDIRDEVIASMDIDAEEDLNEKQATIYTYIRRNPDNPDEFLVDQSVENTAVGDPAQSFKKELLPWIPCVWKRTRKEHYGRGLVEDHYGSFWSLSVLTEAMVTGAAVMTDIKYLVRPGSSLDVVAMNNAPTGTYHYGMPDDVNAIQTNKQSDFSFINAIIQDYRRHLGKVFLSVSSQMRDAERVTAEENRIRAMELEQAHGGTFSTFAVTLQTPMALLLLRDIDVDTLGSTIDPVIVTGLDAMGRSAENEKIRYLFDDLSMLDQVPDSVRMRFKESDLMAMLASGRDVEAEKIIKSEEEFQQEQMQRQQQQTQQMAAQEGAVAQASQAAEQR
jgi:hypothetical protein